jgi:hypothetical protein
MAAALVVVLDRRRMLGGRDAVVDLLHPVSTDESSVGQVLRAA